MINFYPQKTGIEAPTTLRQVERYTLNIIVYSEILLYKAL